MNGGRQAHSTLFGAIWCAPRPVLVNDVVPVGSGGAGIRKRGETGETEHQAAGEEYPRASFAVLNSHEKPP
jgi:hypothetical protein